LKEGWLEELTAVAEPGYSLLRDLCRRFPAHADALADLLAGWSAQRTAPSSPRCRPTRRRRLVAPGMDVVHGILTTHRRALPDET